MEKTCEFLKLGLLTYQFFLQVKNLVAIELAYINTKHPDFHKDAVVVASLVKNAELNQTKSKRHLTSAAMQSINAIVPIENVSSQC